MHGGSSASGKRSRCDVFDNDGGMEMSIETELLMPDSLKRICLSSPRSENVDKANRWPENKTSQQQENIFDKDEDNSYTPAHPLRRPRSLLDESIDNIIRKSRRMYERCPSQSQYLDMQLVPVGPDPLQDRRILGATAYCDRSLSPQGKGVISKILDSNGNPLGLYNSIEGKWEDVIGSYSTATPEGRRRGGDDSLESSDNSSPNNSRYANDLSHTGWILSVDEPEKIEDAPVDLVPAFDVLTDSVEMESA